MKSNFSLVYHSCVWALKADFTLCANLGKLFNLCKPKFPAL